MTVENTIAFLWLMHLFTCRGLQRYFCFWSLIERLVSPNTNHRWDNAISKEISRLCFCSRWALHIWWLEHRDWYVEEKCLRVSLPRNVCAGAVISTIGDRKCNIGLTHYKIGYTAPWLQNYLIWTFIWPSSRRQAISMISTQWTLCNFRDGSGLMTGSLAYPRVLETATALLQLVKNFMFLEVWEEI